jgi:DNA-binding transcriptional regulator YhcF (GntR family)
MIVTLDRTLPISLGVQLRGLIEYGVACGELKRGERLPSVRRMAEDLGVAAMTVAQVFKELQIAGVIRSEPGRGTFVSGDVTLDGPLGRLSAKIQALTAEAAALGIGRSRLAAMINGGTPGFPSGLARGLRLTFVGNYETATEGYVADLRADLAGADRVDGVTFDRLVADPAALAAASASDLLLTVANRAGDLRRLIGGGTPIQVLSFIPAEATRRELAALDPRTRLGLVSTVPEFLPIMKAGVARFAPHIPELETALLDDPHIDTFLAPLDVVVLATGADGLLAQLPATVRAIHYRHTPDPLDIDRSLKPLLERLRGNAAVIRLKETA